MKAGRSPEGAFSLFLWLSLLAVLVFRWDRVLGALVGGPEERIALFTLMALLGGIWVWANRDEPGGASDGSISGFGGFWEAYRENRIAVFAWFVVISLFLSMALAPFLGSVEPTLETVTSLSMHLLPPSLAHPFGTDQHSQDVLARVLFGARISLSVGVLAVAFSLTVGLFLGAVAGYWGGRVDTVIMRLVDMVMAFPRLVLLVVIVAVFDASFPVVVLAIAFTQWPFTARLVRGEILALKEREYAEAARALGFSNWRILFRHLLPNAFAPLVVMATLGIGNAIIMEAGLSFLGLEISAATPSWGAMVDQGRRFMLDAWWVTTFPGLAIVLAVLAFNLVGDGLRDALDPRQGQGVRK